MNLKVKKKFKRERGRNSLKTKKLLRNDYTYIIEKKTQRKREISYYKFVSVFNFFSGFY